MSRISWIKSASDLTGLDWYSRSRDTMTRYGMADSPQTSACLKCFCTKRNTVSIRILSKNAPANRRSRQYSREYRHARRVRVPVEQRVVTFNKVRTGLAIRMQCAIARSAEFSHSSNETAHSASRAWCCSARRKIYTAAKTQYSKQAQ